MVLSLQACESTPTASATEKSPTATPASASASPAAASAASPGPKRLDARSRPSTTTAQTPSKPTSGTASKTPTNDPTAGLLDAGAEVDGNVGANRVPADARRAAQRPTTPSAADAKSATPSNTAAKPAERATWSVLLATYADQGHRAQADAARNDMALRIPELRQAFVRTNSTGSMVLIGHFEGPKDPAAKAQLARVKEMGDGTSRTFPRAMLVRTGASPNDGPPGPLDLRTVRRDFPKGTLYTLQVAAWASLGSKELTMAQIKKSAESYAQQLRTQGFEAYYFHDFDTETSTVTVGVFGPDSYDSKSTLFAPEVEAMMRKFPKSLLNGEEVLVPVDPKKTGSKTVAQSSRLVEVPKL